MQDSGLLNVPDARLYYEVAGAGPAMVFVHGFTFDTRMWDDQWSVFAEHYRVVRYDLRGFGRSAPEPVPYSDVDDLLALLNFLDIERAHLVGLSMGGIVSVHFALGHPGEFAGWSPQTAGLAASPGPRTSCRTPRSLRQPAERPRRRTSGSRALYSSPHASDHKSSPGCERWSPTTPGGARSTQACGARSTRRRPSTSTRSRHPRW
jgi:pimeloyl-ACP methyl ester carboxylesterase